MVCAYVSSPPFVVVTKGRDERVFSTCGEAGWRVLGSSRLFARLVSLCWMVWGAQAVRKQQLWNPFTDGKGDVPSVWVKVHATLRSAVSGSLCEKMEAAIASIL